MTSSNGTIFRVSGPLCGEFTGPGEFPAQRPVARSFDVFFDLRLNKRLSKQPWGWWFETSSWSLWRQCNDKKPTVAGNLGRHDAHVTSLWCFQLWWPRQRLLPPQCITRHRLSRHLSPRRRQMEWTPRPTQLTAWLRDQMDLYSPHPTHHPVNQVSMWEYIEALNQDSSNCGLFY